MWLFIVSSFLTLSRSLLFLPLRDVLVEGLRAVEHRAHVGDLGGFPSDSWWGLRLKEFSRVIIFCLFFSHSLPLLFLPLRDILVEGRRVLEHLGHVGDVGGVPSDSWWGIEVRGVFRV